ncbi:MAG: hypothetical protein ACJ71Y_17050 [Blastococcus sp.]
MLVRLRVAAVLLALATTGCTSFAGPAAAPSTTTSPRTLRPVTAQPDRALTLIADADPAAAAAAMSGALFSSAPVLVLARADDRGGLLLGASAAVGLGVPLLVQQAGTPSSADVAHEVARLGVATVLAVGEADGSGIAGVRVVDVPAAPGALADVTGLDFGAVTAVAAGGDAAAVAGLDPDGPAVLLPDDAGAPPSGRSAGTVPRGRPAEPLDGTVVLATGDDEATTAALATARAAGARVVLTGGTTDPRASDAVLEALADRPADAVVAVGADLAAQDGLDWRLRTAESDNRLPGGGQVLFPGRLLVALYGHPGTGALGVLGEQGIQASIERARQTAAPYAGVVDTPVVPAFEIIATVASSSAGADGNYSAESDPAELRPWVEAAAQAGVYVVLDLQPGRTDFLSQAQEYQSLLELPNVGLALDSEWRLGPNQVHLTQIGSVDVDEVNRVVSWLADLTREKALPQKLLLLHQFRTDMISGRERLDTSRDELAVMVHADGQGSQGDKQATWQRLHENPPAHVWWGWKNFYDEDAPMLSPEQTVAQVSPSPQLISYQ